MSSDLAPFYGLQSATSDFQRVTLTGSEPTGILGRAGLMAVYGDFRATSPTRRGKLVRGRLLCQATPPPPPSVNVTPPMPSAGTSRRELLQVHTSSAACAGCHARMDPIGFGLENLDATGRMRATEEGKPVDDSGEVKDSPIGAFHGTAQLSSKLADDAEAQACFAKQWFRFVFGRTESANDDAAIQAAASTIRGPEPTYRALLLALVTRDEFLTFKK